MSDRDELYYAEMEAERNNASIGYFNARPHLDTRAARDLFDAGFERAFRILWHRIPHETEERRCVKCRTSKRMCDLKPLGIQQCCDGCSHPESENDEHT